MRGYLKDYIPADTRFDYTTELIRLDFNLNILRSNSSALGDSSFFIDEFDGYILMADKRGIGKFSLTSLEQLSYFEYRTSNNDQYVLSIDRNFPDNLLVATGYGGVWLSSDYGNLLQKSINTPYIFDSIMNDQTTLFVSGKMKILTMLLVIQIILIIHLLKLLMIQKGILHILILSGIN